MRWFDGEISILCWRLLPLSIWLANIANCLLVSVSGPIRLTIDKDKLKNSDYIESKMVHICTRRPFLNQTNVEQKLKTGQSFELVRPGLNVAFYMRRIKYLF